MYLSGIWWLLLGTNMKVHELIAALQNVDANFEVILQKDSEGNGYLPICGVDDECVYNLNDREVYSLAEDESSEFPRCVVLFPI